ncbi:helix-turn-helix transcriptional regulator [Caryophanon tenue]|uniref:Uncharacterized protein n=1 Tax=Caryophanon tenue TaxID=33978 RepID=A0A1C0YKV8_9BACL|nr:WYL domain-containing protein [Caryophanon tenue]OCS87790.1 hypothetical protein A6M13_10855 [Caryophanon tenue]
METSQNQRLLSMYSRLLDGERLKKSHEAERYGVSPKTIQRDITDLREILAFDNIELPYDKRDNSYYLSHYKRAFKGEFSYSLAKILFDSRAFRKDELQHILNVLIDTTIVTDRKKVRALASNELEHYTPVRHNKWLMNTVWELANASHHSQYVEMYYLKEHDKTASRRIIKPLGIIFSEYYFYIIAYDAQQEETDKQIPITFRVDRITDFTVLDSNFSQPYASRFEEGKFRKRVQFMHSGELIHLKFKFSGASPQAVLDRLPTATYVQKEDYFIFSAEVFSRGIQMWLLSQGHHIEVLEPASLRAEMQQTITNMLARYS